MGLHEWPLVLFTVFAQTAVGSFIVMSLIILVNDVNVEVKAQLTRNMFFVWVIMGLGFIASTAHLGSPLRAFNAFNQVGVSWLSNEILTGMLFFSFGGIFWLLEVLNKGNEMMRKGLNMVALFIGVIFMYAMVNVYLIDTVPTWNTAYTSLMFVLTVFICGVMLAQILVTTTRYQSNQYQYLSKVVVGVAMVAAIIVNMSQIASLSGIQTSAVAAVDLIPNISSLQTYRIILLVGGVLVWLFANKQGTFKLPIAIAGFGLVLISELISRNVFYNLHMTVGM